MKLSTATGLADRLESAGIAKVSVKENDAMGNDYHVYIECEWFDIRIDSTANEHHLRRIIELCTGKR